MASKYLGISSIIIAVIIYGIFYVYCKMVNMLIFDSITTEFALMKYMTLGKRVDKPFVYE